MTHSNATSGRSRLLRLALAAALVAMIAVGAYLVWPTRTGDKVVAYFASAVGLYPGDDVRVVETDERVRGAVGRHWQMDARDGDPATWHCPAGTDRGNHAHSSSSTFQ